jgi:hypothetical protein
MANSWFNYGLEGFAAGDIAWDSDDIRVMLVKSTYTFDITDQFIADLGSVDNGRSAALSTKTTTNGVLDADNTSITATAAVACNALIVFKHTGSNATARLLMYIDGATNLPITPGAGSAIAVAWSDGSDRIGRL